MWSPGDSADKFRVRLGYVDWKETVSNWVLGIVGYGLLAILTLLPVIVAIIRGVKLHPGGSSFEESKLFSDEARLQLAQNFSRMQGTLGFWKKQAAIFRRFHFYSLCWTIPSSVMIPFLAQAISADPYSKWFVTIVSGYTAILLAFHRAFKVDNNFKAFRQGESEFYDLYRRMLDRPQTFGGTEEEQLAKYFDAVENLRKYIRNAEIDNFPTLEQVKEQLASEKGSPNLGAAPDANRVLRGHRR